MDCLCFRLLLTVVKLTARLFKKKKVKIHHVVW